MQANVDYFAEMPDGSEAILECKTCNDNCREKWDDGAVPFNYELQVRHYMAVMNLDKAFAACLYGNNKIEAVTLQAVHSVLCSMVREKSVVHEDGALYLPRNYSGELETAEAVADILEGRSAAVDIDDELAQSRKKLGIVLSPRQAEAVRMCFSGRISIITGGSGTGKTTVLKVILGVCRHVNPGGSVLLAAPTGRAARRMEESTGEPASTLHSAPGLITDEDNADSLNDTSELAADFIITDEFSMADMALARELFTRMKQGASILLAGDADQLPGVGAGNVFRGLIRCGQIPVTCLDMVFRQANTSRIALNATLMKQDDSRLLFSMIFSLFPRRTTRRQRISSAGNICGRSRSAASSGCRSCPPSKAAANPA